MITNIRRPDWGDLYHIMDIDLKCFDDPWPLEEWRKLIESEEVHILIGTSNTLVAGFIVWQQNKILRLGVKPTYRRISCGIKLLQAVEIALASSNHKKLEILVTESLCDPRDVAILWLLSQGFKGIGISKNAGIYCGYVEDAFIFQKPLTGVSLYGSRENCANALE